MALNKHIQIILSLTLILAAIGCVKKASQHDEGVVLQSYRLIDEQRTDEAVELLESALIQDPKNKEYKTVLASAYAHKAGIKIQNLIPVINQTDRLKKIETKVLELNEVNSAAKQVNVAVIDFASMLHRFAGVAEVYAAIPLMTKKQSVFLVQAIYLLSDLGAEMKPEDALYKSILEVVLFKHILAEELVGEFMQPDRITDQKCRMNLGQVNNAVIRLGRLLVDIYADMAFANPKQAGDTKKLAEKTGDAISNLTIATTAVTAVDETASLFLKRTAIQNGFGKIIKCGGN